MRNELQPPAVSRCDHIVALIKSRLKFKFLGLYRQEGNPDG